VNRLGVDYGLKRVGLAIARSNLKIAHPLKTVSTSNSIDEIKSICGQENISEIVVGIPRSLSGDDTEQTELTYKFIEELNQNLDFEVKQQDEAGTSARARELGATKENIDAVAASVILQDYLEVL